MAEEDSKQQFFTHLNKAQRVLFALPSHINPDIAGAAMALFLFVKKLGKEAEIAASQDFSKSFSFLPPVPDVQPTPSADRSFVIAVNTSKKVLQEVSYKQEAGKTKIFLKSDPEVFSPEDLSFEVESQIPYDLLITLGAQSLEDLGTVFERSPDVFYNTPKVNIDNHPGNKYFGQLNLVDLSATSLAEIAAGLLRDYETDLVDEDMATCLLSGIVAKTQSFQHPQVSPKSFLVASELVAKGARQQEIIKALFKTKPLPLLKLWGRSLVRLQSIGQDTAYAALNGQDFVKSGADLSSLPEVLKELLEHLNHLVLIGLAAENGPDSRIFLAVRLGADINPFVKIFGQPQEHKNLLTGPGFTVLEFNATGATLQEAEAKLKQAIQDLSRPKVS